MSENCHKIHRWFNNLPRLRSPFNEEKIPLNGIYILFEKGEFAHSTDRIVRIGTHTGNNQLRYRLLEHFLNENKDRSIFRKNIGRALLNKDKDPFLEQWEIDLTKKMPKNCIPLLLISQSRKKLKKESLDISKIPSLLSCFKLTTKINDLNLNQRLFLPFPFAMNVSILKIGQDSIVLMKNYNQIEHIRIA